MGNELCLRSLNSNFSPTGSYTVLSILKSVHIASIFLCIRSNICADLVYTDLNVNWTVNKLDHLSQTWVRRLESNRHDANFSPQCVLWCVFLNDINNFTTFGSTKFSNAFVFRRKKKSFNFCKKQDWIRIERNKRSVADLPFWKIRSGIIRISTDNSGEPYEQTVLVVI